MGRTFKDRSQHNKFAGRGDEFRCRHCRMFVGAVPSGGRHRNHCPFCLYSRHVDAKMMGDRGSDCGGSMMPAGMFVRPNGEHTIVHRCMDCGVERHNRIAADDDFERVLSLPELDDAGTNSGLDFD
jgi:hypothetical protein